MALHKWKDLEKKRFSSKRIAASRAWARREVLNLNLRAVREFAGKTQVELSRATDVAQGELSKIERREDHLVSTLRKYVEALGGQLEVIARFDDKTIRLKGV